MSKLNIPPESKKALVDLLDLAPEVMARVVASLSKVEPAVKVTLVRDRIREALRAAGYVDPIRGTDSIMGLCGTRINNDVEVEEFAREVAESLIEERPSSEAAPANRQSNIARLISINALNVALKAAGVMLAQPRLFRRAHVYSDLRPVFSIDVISPFGFVVTHSLRIDVTENGKPDTVYLALDRSDLLEMAKVIERAKAKDDSLRSMMKTAGIKDLECETE